jgi:hypothetical protein
VEPLPFGVFSDANPTIKVGVIILIDGVAIDAAEPTVGVSQPLRPRVLRPELCISAVTWKKVPTRALCSPTSICVRRRTSGDIQMGGGSGRCRCHEDIRVGNGRWRCREDRSRNKSPSVHLAAGATGAAIRAGRRANPGHKSGRRRLRSHVNCA